MNEQNMIHELEALRKFKGSVRRMLSSMRADDGMDVCHFEEEMREVIDDMDAIDRKFGKVGEADGV